MLLFSELSSSGLVHYNAIFLFWLGFKVNTSVKEIPGDPAADPSHPPGCHSRHDEVVEDDEDEHGGDDGGGEGVDQLVVQLQVQVEVDGQA